MFGEKDKVDEFGEWGVGREGFGVFFIIGLIFVFGESTCVVVFFCF